MKIILHTCSIHTFGFLLSNSLAFLYDTAWSKPLLWQSVVYPGQLTAKLKHYTLSRQPLQVCSKVRSS